MPEPTPSHSVPAPLTVTYAVVDGLELECDLYLPPASSIQSQPKARSTIVYWHGGGLTCGDRLTWFPTWLCRLALSHGAIFISADHRLLIPCTGHDVLADMRAIFDFFQAPTSTAREVVTGLPGNQLGLYVDPDRIAAAGTSAGGYLAYLAGCHLGKERVRGVLGMYSMGGNFLIPHYLERKLQPFMNNRPLLPPTSFAPLLSPAADEPQPKAIAGSKLEFDETGYPKDPRILLARYLLQEALWLDKLLGEDGFSARMAASGRPTSSDDGPETQTTYDTAAVPAQHRPLFPQLLPLDNFPPTLLVHGTNDTAVPICESQHLAERLRKAGRSIETLWQEGRGHSFDFHEKGWEGDVVPVVERWMRSTLLDVERSTPKAHPHPNKPDTARARAKSVSANVMHARSISGKRLAEEEAERRSHELEVVG